MLRKFSSGAREDLNFFHSESSWRNHLSLCWSAVVFILKSILIVFTSSGRTRKAKTHCSFLPSNILYWSTYTLEVMWGVHLNQEIYFSGRFWSILVLFLKFLVQFGFQAIFSSHISRAKSVEGPTTVVSESKRLRGWQGQHRHYYFTSNCSDMYNER